MIKQIKETAYIAIDRIVNAKILHRRLGHPGKKRLTEIKHIIQDFEIIGMKDLPDLKGCGVCIKAKKTRIQ